MFKDESDKWRCLRLHHFLNDLSAKDNWFREIDQFRSGNPQKHFFAWPETWPNRDPLFTNCGFTLLDTHRHLLGQVTKEGGFSKFMQKTGISEVKHFNEKYKETGTIFQGPYEIRVIDSDRYLMWVVPYVMCKNTFEMHPKGLNWCTQNFEEAWQWAINYPFSSLGDYAGVRNSPIVDTAPLKEILGGPSEFKMLCRDMILGRKEKLDKKFIDKFDYLSLD